MRYAICNELFGKMDFAKQAELVAKHGFHGIEIAPFTVFGDITPASIASGLKTARAGLSAAGLAFAGLHWLMAKQPDFRLASPDAAERRKGWEYLGVLLEIAGEMGGGDLVFGSAKQRSTWGVPRDEATGYIADGLASLADKAEACNSRILLEALPAQDSDTINTLDEAMAIVAKIGKPGVSGVFDFHNTADEAEPWDILLEKHWDNIRHVHLNEMDGMWPGRSGGDFLPVFSALRKRDFDGWVSLEIFHIPPDPEAALSETMAFLVEMKDRTEAPTEEAKKKEKKGKKKKA